MRKDSPVNAKIIVAQPATIRSLVHYSGSLQESSSTAVSFSVPGTVKSVNVSEGKRVAKGSLVATLDETSAKNALEIATALKSQAEENLRIQRDFYNAGTATLSNLLEAETLRQQASDSYSDAVTGYYTAVCAYLTATGR